jgi:ketosteroid isomerase-like protein
MNPLTDGPPTGRSTLGDEAAVLAANRAFYDAFESIDLDALARTWEHSTRVVCTHPGWPILRGWSAVRESWNAILHGGGALQFILTDVQVEVQTDVAWVTLDENLIATSGASGTVAALNVFTRAHDGDWLLVAHHGSSVVRQLA